MPIALPLSPSFSAALPSHGLVSHALSAKFFRQLNAHNLNAAWKLGYGINAGFLAFVILMNQSRFLSNHYESALDHALRKSIIFTMCAYRFLPASRSLSDQCASSPKECPPPFPAARGPRSMRERIFEAMEASSLNPGRNYAAMKHRRESESAHPWNNL